MNWQEAYFEQAKSDYRVFESLNKTSHECCHQLHYIQMTAEKIAKGLMSGSGPSKSHAALVKMLRAIKQNRNIGRQLGYKNKHDSFMSYIDSCIPFAKEVEELAPAIAGLTKPNPEYPWEDKATSQIIPPSHYKFVNFSPMNIKMQKFTKLLQRLIGLKWS